MGHGALPQVQPGAHRLPRPTGLPPYVGVRVVLRRHDQRDVLGVADDRQRPQRRRPDPGQLVVDQRGRAVSGSGDLVAGDDLEAHLGRPPLLVVEPGDHRVGGGSSHTWSSPRAPQVRTQ